VTAAPILPIAPTLLGDLPQLATPAKPVQGASSFSQLLLDGIDGVSNKTIEADKQVRSFVLDDSIPVHQVTFALEQAQLSLELMVEVRNRVVESYQQLMNMQL
jgi:flagellar hook-basal body complex protein FliE